MSFLVPLDILSQWSQKPRMISETMNKAPESWRIFLFTLNFSLSSVSLPFPLIFAPSSLKILQEIKHELRHRRQRVPVKREEELGSSPDKFSPLKLYNKYYYLPDGGGSRMIEYK